MYVQKHLYISAIIKFKQKVGVTGEGLGNELLNFRAKYLIYSYLLSFLLSIFLLQFTV